MAKKQPSILAIAQAAANRQKSREEQAARMQAAQRLRAMGSISGAIGRATAGRPAAVNRQQYQQSQGLERLRRADEERRKRLRKQEAQRNALEQAAANRANALVGQYMGRQQQPAQTAAPVQNDPLHDRLVQDVAATGRLPSGYSWYGKGSDAIAVDNRGLAYKPLEGVTAGSKAATPSVYGIDPDKYLEYMHAYDAWEAEKSQQPEAVKRARESWQPVIDAETDPVRKVNLQKLLDESIADATYSPAEQRKRNRLEKAAMEAVGYLGEDIGQYAGRSNMDYLRSYGQQFGIQQEGEAYGENYRQPWFQRKGSDAAVHADLMQKLKMGEVYGDINPVDALETGDSQLLQGMSDADKAVYMGIASRYGVDTARAYWDAMKQEGQYGQKAYSLRDAAYRDMADKSWLGSSALSVASNVASISGTLYGFAQKMTGKEIDPYADQFMFGQMTGTIRDEVGQNITKNFGNEDGTDNFGSWLMKTGYNAGMSSLDSLVAGTLSGGSALAGSLMQGASGASSVIQDAKLRGATDEQALLLGGLSVVTETATEYIPMDTLLKTIDGKDVVNFRQLLTNALKGGLSEAPGEGLSEVLSVISDNQIMGAMSNYNLNVEAYMRTGMTEDEARRKASGDVIWDVFNAAATGFLSGEGSNLMAGSRSLAANALMPNNTTDYQGTVEAVRKLAETTGDAELRTIAEQAGQEMSHTGNVEAAKQGVVDRMMAAADAVVAKQQNTAQSAAAAIAENENGVSMFDQPMQASFVDAASGGDVTVVGFDTTTDGRDVILHTVDQNGNEGTATIAELEFADDTVSDLLSADDARGLDGDGLRNYLNGYVSEVDGHSVAPGEYAKAYGMVYRRAAAGMDMQQAIGSSVIPQVMTETAMQDAYAAGLGAAAQQQTAAPLSPAATGNAGVMNRSFTKAAWQSMSRQQQRTAAANMEVVGQLAKRMNATINIVDSLTDGNGGKVNGRFDPSTGVIDIALDADGNAYAYVAMHELTHKMKAEHAKDFDTFAEWVQEGLQESGQDFEALVQYQMDTFGYSREDAIEEVLCNTVPALLESEENLRKLYKQDKSLFERVMDWLKGLIADVQAAGKNLSQRSRSWAQMDALAADEAQLQGLYDVMESIMLAEREKSSAESELSYSRTEKEYNPDTAGIKEQIRNSLSLLSSLKPVAEVNVPTNLNNAQKAASWAIELLKQTGFQVDRQYFGRILFSERDIKDAVKYAKTNEERAALAVLPQVLKRGIEIGRHNDHKLRKKQTVTFAAPVIINGIRGNVAVVVNLNGNHYYTHRILLPDGETFTFSTQQKEVLPGMRRGVTENSSLANATSSTSESTIHEITRNVKNSLSDYDSTGATLSSEQQAYFADSKIRDEQGRLMVVYHGTPSGNYEHFRSGTYFTPNREYADVYQNPGASSISYGKKQDAPTTFAMYLNMEKPFDTRNPKERSIFMKEYYRKYGTGAPLSESGLPDWTDGMDLQEFIEEMEYDYDGLILDEGGVPDGDGGVKSRGLSYVIFDPAQAKAVDNKTPTEDKRFRFSMSDYDATVKEGDVVLEDLLTMTAAHKMTDAEARRVAQKALKAGSSTMNADDAARRIKEIFDYASRSGKVDVDGLNSEVRALAEEMMSQSATLDEQHEADVADLRSYLKTTPIALSPGQQREAAHLMDSYGAYRRALFGQVNLRKSGIGLDQVWGELNEMYPHLFPADTSEGDQVRVLMDIAEYVKPVYRNETGFNMEESIQWMTHEIYNAYMSLSGVQSAAKEQNRLGLKLRDYRAITKRFAQEHKAAYEEMAARVASAADRRVAEAESKAERRADMAIRDAEDTAAREIRKAQEQARQDITDAVSAEMQFSNSRIQEAQMRAEAYIKKVSDADKKARYQAQIIREANQMIKKLEKPTDKNHVQHELAEPLAEFLRSLNTGRKTVDQRALGDRIIRLKLKMAAAGAEGEGHSVMVDPDMLATMEFLGEQLKHTTSLDELNVEQMMRIRNIVHHASWIVGKADEAFADARRKRISDSANEWLAQVKRRKDVKQHQNFVIMRNFLKVGQLDSFHFFDKLGGTAREMFQNLRDGWDKKIRHRADAMEFVEKAKEGLSKKAQKELFAGKRARKETYTLTNGSIELTRPQLMELYCLAKRPQARMHLFSEKGGIRSTEGRRLQVTEEDVQKLTDNLTAEEKKLADTLQRYMVDECARWGNETSMNLYGYQKFTEENYYPIRVDQHTVESNISESGKTDNLYAVANMGMTKALQDVVTNGLMLGDIFDTFSRHVDNMATYNGLAAPITDLVRWYNYKGKDSSVKEELAFKFGREYMEYIPRLIRDINGEKDKSYNPGITDKGFSNMKSSAVGSNLRVIIQQPTAILRAGSMMSYQHIMRGMVGLKGETGRRKLREATELAKKHCPIAALKAMGFYETDIGKSMRTAMFDDRTAVDKMKDAGMSPAGKADELTFGMIWRACEAETRKLHTELTVGSEAYYKAVGQRMSEIIDYTQVVDTPLHRTQLMRSNNALAKMATSFMSEPSKTYNMIYGAVANYVENRKDPVAKRKLARTLSAFVITGVVNGMAQSLIDAIRDDEDEEWWKKFCKHFFGDYSEAENFWQAFKTFWQSNLAQGYNPFGMIPFIKDALSLAEGWDVNRPDMQSAEKLFQVGENVGKLFTGKNKLSGWGWAQQAATAVDSVTGLSLNNLLRDGYAVTNLLFSSFGAEPPISKQTEAATTSVGYDNLYKAMLTKDAKRFDRVSGKMSDKHGKTEKDLDSELAVMLAEDEDERVVAAYTAKDSGKAVEYGEMRAAFAQEYAEVFGSDTRCNEVFDKAVRKYGKLLNDETEEEEETEEKPLKARAWTNKEMGITFAGLANGSVSKADAEYVLSEMIADSTAKDPEKTVRTNLWVQLKPLYLAAEGEEKKALAGIIKKYCGKTDKDLQKAEKDAAKKATEDESK